ncbi:MULTISPECIES: hypothetical protein [unclassified Streptomyces]|uniref:hypothetical protein n=1 Tax=unclassified Streptomyces TaxID=2593676 RepID=UPI0029A110A0|nr:hypothetical protein [Streptomyces sp. DK15]MDX2389357.1 hypothetical protein [Streptomyces sp. DK15]
MSDLFRELWPRGVAFNPAAPSDVLMRLVDRTAGEVGALMCEGRPEGPAGGITTSKKPPNGR